MGLLRRCCRVWEGVKGSEGDEAARVSVVRERRRVGRRAGNFILVLCWKGMRAGS